MSEERADLHIVLTDEDSVRDTTCRNRLFVVTMLVGILACEAIKSYFFTRSLEARITALEQPKEIP